MAKKKEEGITEPVEPTTPTEPAPELEPPQEPSFELPPELKDMSKEDIARQLQNTKKKLGEQGEELGKVRDDVEYYRRKEDDRIRQAEMYVPSSQPEPPQTQQTPAAITDADYDFNKPAEFTRAIFKEEMQKIQQQAQVGSRQSAINEGKMAYQQGRDVALRQEPELYKGIEKEVEQRVYNTYAPFANQGVSVKEYVGDPSIWKKVAQNIRLDREEYEYFTPPKKQPMTATPTETPTSAKPATSEISGQYDVDMSDPDLRAFQDALAREGHPQSPEEAKEIIKKEQDRLFKGERW